MAEDVRTVLEFRDVVWTATSLHEADLQGLSFRLEPGEIITVSLEKYARYVPFCDLASGLLTPGDGEVRYEGKSWSAMSASEQADRREGIGRVFDGYGWVSNLTVLDNVLLSQCHHTRRNRADILAEVEALAHAAGIDPIPDVLVDRVPAPDLKRAEWVRAFLGQRRLVLLERPEEGLPDGVESCLLDLVGAAVKQGTAIVWLSTSRAIAQDKRLTISKGFTIEGSRWIEHPGGRG